MRTGRGIARRIYRRLRPVPPAQGDYIAAAPTVAAAKAAGQTVEEYVETLWGGIGGTAAIVERMRAAGALQRAETVVEIGPGTGRYLARVRELVKPQRHVIFETAEDWRQWLVAEYDVESPDADGESLPDVEHADLVHAHGVFVYTPFLVTARYLVEIRRVRPRWAVFDFYAASEFDDAALASWWASKERYPVVLERDWVLSRLPDHELVDEWTPRHGHGHSRYVILRRRE